MLNVKDNGNSVWRPQDSLKHQQDKNVTTSQPQYRPAAGETIALRAPATTSHAAPVAAVTTDLCTENGKLELSLINFKLSNPDWKPTDMTQRAFIDFITSNAIREEEDAENREVTSTQHMSLTKEQLDQLSTLSRDRSRLRHEEQQNPSTSNSSNLAMTLSTLFLHEYATAQSQPSVSFARPSSASAHRSQHEYEPLLGQRR